MNNIKTKFLFFYLTLLIFSFASSLTAARNKDQGLKPPLSSRSRKKRSTSQNSKNSSKHSAELNNSIKSGLKRRNTNYDKPWIQDTTQRKKKKKHVDYQEENKKNLERMKHFNKNNEYIMILEDDNDINIMKKSTEDEFYKVTGLIPQSFRVPEEVFQNQTLESPEVFVVDELRLNSLTRQKWLNNMTLYENLKSHIIQFDVDNYENKEKVYKDALTTYTNLLSLLYVSKPIYNFFAKKMTISGASTSERSKNPTNIQEKLEKKNAKYNGNAVVMELFQGQMPIDDIKGFLMDRDEINNQMILKMKDPQYIEDYKSANGQIVHINGLKSMRIEIAKNFAFKNIKYNDFGFTRLGFTNYDTLEVIQKRYEYCLKMNGNGSQIIEMALGSGEFEGIPVTLGLISATKELIFKMTLNLALEETLRSVLLLNKMSLLILSKYILSDFLFFGFTNINQTVAYDFGFASDKKHSFPVLDFVRIFRTFDKETQGNENLTYIYENCSEIKNELISEPYLGTRRKDLDIVEANYSFVAFKVEDKYRFVFRSHRPQIFKEVDPVQMWRNANKKQMGDQFECSYHNDDYFLGINFYEMYLISFFIDEQGLQHLKEKKKMEVKAETKDKKVIENKIKKGADINSLFNNLLI